jgi:hypothetical protein
MTPNFVLLDSTLPDVARLVTAMVTDRFPLVVEALARLRSRYCIIVGLGGAAAWPLAAGAQQAGKLRTIGFLGPNAHSAANEWVRFGAATARRRDLAHKAATSAWVGVQP